LIPQYRDRAPTLQSGRVDAATNRGKRDAAGACASRARKERIMLHRALALGASLCAASVASAGDAFVGSTFGTVYRWNGSGVNVALPTMCTQIDSAAADGTRLFVADSFGALHRVETTNSMQVTTITWSLPAPANSLAVSGDRIYIGSRQGQVRRIDGASGAVLQTVNVSSDLNGMALHGDFLFAGGSNTLIYKINTVTGQSQMIGACGGLVKAMATNGTHVFAGTPTGVVYRYTTTGSYQGTFTVAGMNISAMAMDGDTLVISDEAGVVKRVNSATGAVLSSANIPEAATAVAVIGTTCRPDMNDDGQLNVADFSAYLATYSSGSIRADMNDDTLLNVADFTAYLRAYAAGCN
jgi:outer membrane protein assembly factor BamB